MVTVAFLGVAYASRFHVCISLPHPKKDNFNFQHVIIEEMNKIDYFEIFL